MVLGEGGQPPGYTGFPGKKRVREAILEMQVSEEQDFLCSLHGDSSTDPLSREQAPVWAATSAATSVLASYGIVLC